MGTIGGDELTRWEGAQDSSGGGIVGGAAEDRILVSVRLRPLNEKEIANRDSCDWECINQTTIIFKNSFPERSMFPIAYSFDRVFRSNCNTRQVYEEGAKEVALSVVSGVNSSIFAYGQTSSGKTYTMSGITECAVADIYDYIKKHEEREFILKFSAMEIYNEAVRDLLSSDSTPLRLLDDPERGTIVDKLTEETLRDWGHLRELLSFCEAQRQVGETSLNETSSRSHQILRLTIESSAREFLGKDNLSSLAASVDFVDLAGSERASQAMSAGARLKEGCHINRSLLTLGTVIRKLSKGKHGHVPYRDSKLTRILQTSLGGNARTAIICTMSPARSHIEQSRNTLLFATCAKEVATNAKVNVVMSDKALVKQLQKELARLESELRYPNLTPSASHAEALLKEKDNQIRKMEKEIKELMQQRDLAQSRLEDLLRAVGDDQASRQWALHQPHILHRSNACEDDNSISGASSVAYRDLDSGIKKLSTSPYSENGSDVISLHYLRQFDKQSEKEVISPRRSVNSPSFVGLLQQQDGEDITLDNSEEFEDLCKEVRCIEMDDTSISTLSRHDVLSTEGSDSLPHAPEGASIYADNFSNAGEVKDLNNNVSAVTVCTLEQQLQNARNKNNIVKPPLGEPSPWFSTRDFESSRSLALTRSRSCRASFTHSPASPWFYEEHQNGNTPPSWSLKDFPGRPAGFPRRVFPLNYAAEHEMLSGKESQSSVSIASVDKLEAMKIKTSSSEDITSIGDFVAGIKEMAQIQYQKQHADDQEMDEGNDTLTIEKGMKNVGVDPMLNSIQSPSWSFDFEKQRQEVIRLWDDCNVSLVHRTYFFLLFRGDPADSIYMEVELRRLSFLKRASSEGDVHRAVTRENSFATSASSMRALRREREMLCRRMQKKLSSEERAALYREWGIALDSKQRRLQLACLLWSNNEDMEHIRESASIVAKLVGLLEPGQALKEMFGLSFTPQITSRRSYSWKHGMSSLA